MKQLFSAILLAILLSADLPFPVADNGLAWAEDPEEQRLWNRAAEEEKRFETSGQLYRNTAMEHYLESVISKLVPSDTPGYLPIKVGIIKNRSCNAFILPNGRIYIHSGMLAAMENEAQLATILGHEVVHALNRHMLKEIRDAREKTAISSFMGALTGNVLLPLGQLGALASIKGYSRDMEAEADHEGLRLLIRAKYDPDEAVKVFTTLRKEADVEEKKEPFFFSSHPKLQARIDSYENLLKSEFTGNSGGVTNGNSYLKTFGPLLLDSAEMDLKAGRFDRAQSRLKRYLTINGNSARAYLLLGESQRHGMKQSDLAAARESYLKSAALDPAYPDPHRLLGLLAYKQNDMEQALKSLERYLELAANAPDRLYIEEMLKNIRLESRHTPGGGN